MSDDIANGAAPVADAVSDAAHVSESTAPTGGFREGMEAIAAKYYPEREVGTGRFASRNTDTTDEAAPAEAAPSVTETTDQPEQSVAETAPAPSIEPPAAWSAEVKAKWATLPPDVQTYIAQRESEAHKAITQAGARLKDYEGLDAVLGPRREALKASWGNEGTALQQLFQLSDFATSNPSGFVQWFAQQNGVDLSRLTSASAVQANADPQVAALQHELSTIKSSITQQQMTQLDNDIRTFATAKDDAGNPLRPHFEEVRADMARLLSAEIATSLEDAYNRAIRLNDAVWSKVQAGEAAQRAKAAEAEEAKRREAQAKAAAEAKKAASINVRAVGAVSGSPVRSGSMRETMEAVARKYAGAA